MCSPGGRRLLFFEWRESHHYWVGQTPVKTGCFQEGRVSGVVGLKEKNRDLHPARRLRLRITSLSGSPRTFLTSVGTTTKRIHQIPSYFGVDSVPTPKERTETHYDTTTKISHSFLLSQSTGRHQPCPTQTLLPDYSSFPTRTSTRTLLDQGLFRLTVSTLIKENKINK